MMHLTVCSKKTILGHCTSNSITIRNPSSFYEFLLYACHHSDIKAWFLHKEEMFACLSPIYHRGMWDHRDDGVNRLDINKYERGIALILAGPQCVDG